MKDDPSRCIENALLACAYRNSGTYDPLIFAFSLFHCLVRGHCFVDGNTRVSWAALALVLQLEGLTVDAGVDQAEAFVLGVAAGERSKEDAEAWLLERLVTTESNDPS